MIIRRGFNEWTQTDATASFLMKGDHESGCGHPHKPEIVIVQYCTIDFQLPDCRIPITNGCFQEEAVRFCQYADNRDGNKAAAFSATQSPADVGGRILEAVAETDRERERRRRVMGQ